MTNQLVAGDRPTPQADSKIGLSIDNFCNAAIWSWLIRTLSFGDPFFLLKLPSHICLNPDSEGYRKAKLRRSAT